MRGEGVGAAGCFAGCCQDIYSGSGDGGSNSDDNVSLYEEKQFSLSELIASYWLEG